MIGHLNRLSLICIFACASLLLSFAPPAQAQSASAAIHQKLFQCGEREGILCAEQFDVPSYEYVGHDEPSLLFYSPKKGAGYRNVWRLRLPKDPPTLPRQNGHGGVWNFQLHPAFWFGMAMCDDQGNPNPGGSPGRPNIPCAADSDTNIFDSPDPAAPDYIGNHPGTAFMEMQFYPPGWISSNAGVLDADSATKWTAALNIDSFQSNGNTGQNNNPACAAVTANEYVNFAFIQTDGVPFPPGSPSPLGPIVSTNANTLRMNPGDELIVKIADTEHGLKVTIQDLTTGQTGFMVASGDNGFASVKWDPDGNNCDFATHNLAHDFHPAYATSSEHTRVPDAAHSYNIAFSDEIGHFEYCGAVDAEGGNCLTTKKNDPPGLDDAFCFDAKFLAAFGLIPLGGCADADADFDGVPYRGNTWPGSLEDVQRDQKLHAEPVVFSSPLLINSEGDTENFDRVAFEADIPRVEDRTVPPCQRFVSNPGLPNPGSGCVPLPVGADFYPIYTTQQTAQGCRWRLGGAHLPGTDQDFGGNSVAEYGSTALVLFYAGPNNQPSLRVEDYRRILSSNPCPASEGAGDD